MTVRLTFSERCKHRERPPQRTGKWGVREDASWIRTSWDILSSFLKGEEGFSQGGNVMFKSRVRKGDGLLGKA